MRESPESVPHMGRKWGWNGDKLSDDGLTVTWAWRCAWHMASRAALAYGHGLRTCAMDMGYRHGRVPRVALEDRPEDGKETAMALGVEILRRQRVIEVVERIEITPPLDVGEHLECLRRDREPQHQRSCGQRDQRSCGQRDQRSCGQRSCDASIETRSIVSRRPRARAGINGENAGSRPRTEQRTPR